MSNPSFLLATARKFSKDVYALSFSFPIRRLVLSNPEVDSSAFLASERTSAGVIRARYKTFLMAKSALASASLSRSHSDGI